MTDMTKNIRKCDKLNLCKQFDKDRKLVYGRRYTELVISFLKGWALSEESSQTNVILQYKLLAAILSAVFSVIQQS